MPLFVCWDGIFDIKLDGLRSIDNPLCAKILKYKQRENLLVIVWCFESLPVVVDLGVIYVMKHL